MTHNVTVGARTPGANLAPVRRSKGNSPLVWRLIAAFAILMALHVAPHAQAQFRRRVQNYTQLTSIPVNTFSCRGHPAGYYADMNYGCQVYHMCDTLGKKFSYLCPNQTLFNQKFMICDHWYMVNCSNSQSYYSLNHKIGSVDGESNTKVSSRKFKGSPKTTTTTQSPNDIVDALHTTQGPLVAAPVKSNFATRQPVSPSKPIHPGTLTRGRKPSVVFRPNNKGGFKIDRAKLEGLTLRPVVIRRPEVNQERNRNFIGPNEESITSPAITTTTASPIRKISSTTSPVQPVSSTLANPFTVAVKHQQIGSNTVRIPPNISRGSSRVSGPNNQGGDSTRFSSRSNSIPLIGIIQEGVTVVTREPGLRISGSTPSAPFSVRTTQPPRQPTLKSTVVSSPNVQSEQKRPSRDPFVGSGIIPPSRFLLPPPLMKTAAVISLELDLVPPRRDEPLHHNEPIVDEEFLQEIPTSFGNKLSFDRTNSSRRLQMPSITLGLPQFSFRRENAAFFIPTDEFPVITEHPKAQVKTSLAPDNNIDSSHPHSHLHMTMVFPRMADGLRIGSLSLNPKCPMCHPAFLKKGKCYPCVRIR